MNTKQLSKLVRGWSKTYRCGITRKGMDYFTYDGNAAFRVTGTSEYKAIEKLLPQELEDGTSVWFTAGEGTRIGPDLFQVINGYAEKATEPLQVSNLCTRNDSAGWYARFLVLPNGELIGVDTEYLDCLRNTNDYAPFSDVSLWGSAPNSAVIAKDKYGSVVACIMPLVINDLAECLNHLPKGS